jgi:ABC-type dipeptide/oligopeptide/nickel transport system ATPase subunit
MAVAAYDTQQGATLTLGTDSLTLRLVSIGPVVESVGNIPLTNLANTTKKTWTPGELADYDEIQVVYQNSPGIANPTKVVQTITITGPTASGASTPESVTGTAYVRSFHVLPGYSSENEGLQMKTMVIKYDGATGPTRTVSS